MRENKQQAGREREKRGKTGLGVHTNSFLVCSSNSSGRHWNAHIKFGKGSPGESGPGRQPCWPQVNMSGLWAVTAANCIELHFKLYGKGFYVCTETDWQNYPSVVHTESRSPFSRPNPIRPSSDTAELGLRPNI